MIFVARQLLEKTRIPCSPFSWTIGLGAKRGPVEGVCRMLCVVKSLHIGMKAEVRVKRDHSLIASR